MESAYAALCAAADAAARLSELEREASLGLSDGGRDAGHPARAVATISGRCADARSGGAILRCCRRFPCCTNAASGSCWCRSRASRIHREPRRRRGAAVVVLAQELLRREQDQPQHARQIVRPRPFLRIAMSAIADAPAAEGRGERGTEMLEVFGSRCVVVDDRAEQAVQALAQSHGLAEHASCARRLRGRASRQLPRSARREDAGLACPLTTRS